jgi:peptidoglycan biosynthesis protein MviN/MurJ (putative lipid II flippase)
MKTTRILGYVAGILAALAMVTLGFGLILTMNPERFPNLTLGYGALIGGVVAVLVSIIPGVVHFALRAKFRRPFHDAGVPQGFRIAGRVLLGVWWLALVAGAALAIYLGSLGFI